MRRFTSAPKPAVRVASIIELLSQTNEILEDMYVIEGNLPTGHKTTVRTGLPQATWRLLNTGVPNAKSTTAQLIDACGNLETYSVIDKDIADLNGNTAEFRLSEVKSFLEGMSQQVAATLIYGNQFANPLGLGALVAIKVAQICFHRRSRREGLAHVVVYNLHEQVPCRASHDQTRTSRRTGDLLAHPGVTALAGDRLLVSRAEFGNNRHGYFLPAFPALRRITSPA